MEQSVPTDPIGRVVLVKGMAGLGNRIYAVLSAILYAKLAGRRVVVDWRDGLYADRGTNAFPLLFRSASAASMGSHPPSGSVAPWIWERRLEMSAVEMYRHLGAISMQGCPFAGRLYSFDMADLHHPEDVLVTWSLIPAIDPLRRHFTGRWREWRGIDDEAILARLLREHLEVHPEIEARVEEIRRTWPDRPRIGVHVRNTDRTTNLRRLQRRLDAVMAADPDAVVFLATDAASVEDAFRRRYPDVLTVPKWFPPGGPLHRQAALCPDLVEMARVSLVEMRLLAGCDHLVINGSSSFSVITKLWWKGGPGRVIDIGSGAWLPASVRDRVWRLRDAVRWARRLRKGRLHIERQRAGYATERSHESGQSETAVLTSDEKESKGGAFPQSS